MRIVMTLIFALTGTSALAHSGHIAHADGHSHTAVYAALLVIVFSALIAVSRRRLAVMKSDA